MRKKQRYIIKQQILFKVLKLVLFLIISYLAIKIGVTGGNFLSGMDAKLIRDIDAGNFKTALNKTLPVIDTIYNSGNVSVSFSREVKKIINMLFDFDLDTPITILNSNSIFLNSYYNKNYQLMVAEKENKFINDKEESDIEIPKEEDTEIKEDASSISSDDETEKREIKDNGVITNGKITINNETKYKVDIEELLKQPLKIKFDKKGPKVLIYHTHTTESYLKSLNDLYKAGVPVRNSDPVFNVVRVGDELAQNLRKKYAIDVVHNGTINNYPSDVGAYGRSLNLANKILKSYPSIKIALDIHRDGAGDNEKLRAVSTINKKNTAQVMFVIGTDATGLKHPNWKENLKLALKLQEKLNELSPGLAKPIYISKNRYNQNITNGALIIEVGGDGNLLSEALESTKYLAQAIDSVVNNK